MGKGESESYDDIVTDIYDLQKFSGRITLDPITEAMQQLDEPHNEFAAVHVAGTNGKGSTTTILASMLEAAGYTVGTYTSPHLTDFRERIQVNGEQISREQVAAYYRQLQDTGVELSFFECTTALAFMHFAAADVDVAVIETGIGGRLDATNIVTPELSIITNVASDHTAWLGETPEQIAYEKAGIIKEQTPVVSGASGDPQQVIETVAQEKDADVVPVEPHASSKVDEHDGHTLQIELEDETIPTTLIGDYQVDNINTALTARTLLEEYDIPDNAIREAFSRLALPGRMEKIADYPLVLLEGAHNPEGMERAADTVDRIKQGKTIAVVSIMGDKDYEAMMDTIESFADLILLSAADIDRAAAPEDLAECIEGTDYEIVPNICTTVEKTLQMAEDDDTIIFTGSLYFVGDIKQTIDDLWYEPA